MEGWRSIRELLGLCSAAQWRGCIGHCPYHILDYSGTLEDFWAVRLPRWAMLNLLWCLLLAARSLLNTQRDLALENLALRHQIGVPKRTLGNRPPHLNHRDRGWFGTAGRPHEIATASTGNTSVIV
jgi:hypothetical protein